MAETKTRSSGARRRQSSRLQSRAPASIKISPLSNWNVVIPLLSPLVASPEARDWPEEVRNQPEKEPEEKPVIFKKWQHPAAPFSYESTPPLMVPFICTAGSSQG
ncbi:uncharacterized protein At4g14450, chloroplastic-like [Impatiens glandulifera]|uniref:uncharacterized protein At4g14450, chloroplastic-like n=1 Tax=Impatiens glandulifera TaxID=253017 RepID=UPI001FB193D4|nr:uncharacterized protein At4g14450, chloroplastic-like [Impatiens glandulifera]